MIARFQEIILLMFQHKYQKCVARTNSFKNLILRKRLHGVGFITERSWFRLNSPKMYKDCSVSHSDIRVQLAWKQVPKCITLSDFFYKTSSEHKDFFKSDLAMSHLYFTQQFHFDLRIIYYFWKPIPTHSMTTCCDSDPESLPCDGDAASLTTTNVAPVISPHMYMAVSVCRVRGPVQILLFINLHRFSRRSKSLRTLQDSARTW